MAAVTLLNAASAAYGTIMTFGTGAVTAIDITSLSPSVDVNEVEVTNINSPLGFQEFIPTSKGMEISFDFNYSPLAATAGNSTAFIFTALRAGTIHNPMTIVWNTPTPVTWNFAAFIRNASIEGSPDGALSGSGTLRVTGTIDFV